MKNNILTFVATTCTLSCAVMPLCSCVPNISKIVGANQNNINITDTEKDAIGLTQHVSIEPTLDLADVPYSVFFTESEYSFDDTTGGPLTIGLRLDCDGSNIRVNGIQSILVLNSFVAEKYSYLKAGKDFNNFRHEGNIFYFDITESGKGQILYLLRNPNPDIVAKLAFKPTIGGPNYDIDMKVEGLPFKTLVGVLPSDTYTLHLKWDVYRGKGVQAAQWYYKSQPSKIFECPVDVANNIIYINRELGVRFHDDIVLLLHLQGTGDGVFEYDSWDNLNYWVNFFGADAKKIATVYAPQSEEEKWGKDFGKDWLIGQKRHVLWDGVSHDVMVVSTNQFLLANKDKMVLEEYKGDVSNKTAALTFQFTNLLTDHNYNLVKKKFSNIPQDDEDYSNWVRYNEAAGESHPSKMRSFITSKNDFLNKFDPELLACVKTTAHDHWTQCHDWWDAIPTECRDNFIGDKFWIPTAREIGGPILRGDYDVYWTETRFWDRWLTNYDGCVMFQYWQNKLGDGTLGEVLERAYTSVPKNSTEPGMHSEYWLSTPSRWGSGQCLPDDDMFVTPSAGKLDHCNMDHEHAILPCFSI